MVTKRGASSQAHVVQEENREESHTSRVEVPDLSAVLGPFLAQFQATQVQMQAQMQAIQTQVAAQLAASEKQMQEFFKKAHREDNVRNSERMQERTPSPSQHDEENDMHNNPPRKDPIPSSPPCNHHEQEGRHSSYMTAEDFSEMFEKEQAKRSGLSNAFDARPPFSARIMRMEYPVGYITPQFTLYNGRTGNAREHVMRFTDALSRYANNEELRLREFAKSLTDRAFTWYTTLAPNSIHSWEEMVTIFSKKFFSVEDRVTLNTLSKERQRPNEDLTQYVRRFRYLVLDCHEPTTEEQLVQICVDGAAKEYRAYLEVATIPSFEKLYDVSQRLNTVISRATLPRYEDRYGRRDKRESAMAAENSGRRPFQKNTSYQSDKKPKYNPESIPPPFPCSMAEVLRIVEVWIADGVLYLPSPFQKPTEEDKRSNKYCVYHQTIRHSTKDCFSLRRIFNDKIAAGHLKISTNPEGSVHQDPLPNHKAKDVVAMVCHNSAIMTEKEVEEEIILNNQSAIETLSQSSKFKNFFDQMHFSKAARIAATAALTTVAEAHSEHCFLAYSATRKAMPEIQDVSFTADDMKASSLAHNKPLYVTALINSIEAKRALIDPGSSLNLIPLSTAIAMGLDPSKISKQPIEISGFGGQCQNTIGYATINLQVGPINSAIRVHVIEANVSYHILLGRPWIHKFQLIPSTFHQCVKGTYKGKVIRILATATPFDKAEAHISEALFYDELAEEGETAFEKTKGVMPPSSTILTPSEISKASKRPRDESVKTEILKGNAIKESRTGGCKRIVQPDGKVVYIL